MIKSKQVNKFLLARMVLTNVSVPSSGSPTDFILVDTTTDVGLLNLITGTAYDGSDMPITGATNTQEGVVTGDVVEVLNSSGSVSFYSNELYARLSLDGVNLKFSLFTVIDGVETPASVDVDTLGVSDIDLLFTYKYKFVNLPEDAITRTKRSYIGDDPTLPVNGNVPYIEPVTVVTNNVLPDPSVAVAGVTVGVLQKYDVRVFVNGVYESGVTYDQSTNALTWDSNALGYSVTPTDTVVYKYLVNMETLANLVTSPTFPRMTTFIGSGAAGVQYLGASHWTISNPNGYTEFIATSGADLQVLTKPQSVLGEVATANFNTFSLEVGETYDIEISYGGGGVSTDLDAYVTMPCFGDVNIVDGKLSGLVATDSSFGLKLTAPDGGTTTLNRYLKVYVDKASGSETPVIPNFITYLTQNAIAPFTRETPWATPLDSAAWTTDKVGSSVDITRRGAHIYQFASSNALNDGDKCKVTYNLHKLEVGAQYAVSINGNVTEATFPCFGGAGVQAVGLVTHTATEEYFSIELTNVAVVNDKWVTQIYLYRVADPA